MSLAQMALLKRILQAGENTVELPLARMRENFETFACRFPGIDGVEAIPIELGGVPAEKVVVHDADEGELGARRGAILYLHGGGFVTGSAKSHRMLAARLARAAGATAYVLDYRLAPEHPFPAALEDTLAAWEALGNLQAVSNIAGPLALAGDSAGAGLAIVAASRLAANARPLPVAMALFSPWADLTGCASVDRHEDPMVRRSGLLKMASFFLGERDPRDPAISPLYTDLRGLPPVYLQVGGADALYDDSVALAERLRDQDVAVELEVWPGMIHLWQLFASRLEEGAASLEKAGFFLKKALRVSTAGG